MRPCVVNFAKGSWYPRGAERLGLSLIEVGYRGPVLRFTDESQLSICPPHVEVPYAFKIYAIEEAVRQGYDCVLWCDASVWAQRPLDPIFYHAAVTGHLFLYNTNAGEWTSDAMLDYFKLDRETALNIPMLHATTLCLNFGFNRTNDFFELWKAAIPHFPGSWTNENQQVSRHPRVKGHRHDQSAASIIAFRLGMELWPYQRWLGFPPAPDSETAILAAQGM